MNKLTQAFIRAEEIKLYAFTFYTPKPAQKLSKDRYDTIRAEVLEAVLLNLPKQEDNKQKMLTAQKITKDCMVILGRELA